MKKVVISCFFMIFVVSCASNGDVSHWQGESVSSVVEKYGMPDTYLKLDDGNKVLEYDQHSSLNYAKNFCSLTFIVDHSNRIMGAARQGNGTNCLN